jgi:hypothetical protein
MKKITLLAVVAVMLLVVNISYALTAEEIGETLDKATKIAARIETSTTAEMAINATNSEVSDATRLHADGKISAKDYHNVCDRADIVKSVLYTRKAKLRGEGK